MEKINMEETRNVYNTLTREPDGKRPQHRPRHRRKDMKISLKDTAGMGVD
jgi:hypothetical protein